MQYRGFRQDPLLESIASAIENRTGYKLVPELTRYGTGSAVLVFDTGGDPRYVACKVVLEPLDERRLKNFLREVVRALKAQGHPLVVGITIVTAVMGKPVIFMQHCEKNLRDYIVERGKLKTDEALALAIQIAKGLIYLKHRGFIAHQDLKPENILLRDICKQFEETPRELCYRPKIADFGLANAWLEAGRPGGSNPYRAPEQFIYKHVSREKAEELYREGLFNPDVFALGIILTEMLTGKHPSGIPSSEVMREEIAGNTGFWEKWSIDGERVVEVDDEDLKQLILRMLNQNPKHRPSLEEVYSELMRILKNLNPDLYEYVETYLNYYDEIAKRYEEFLDDVNTLGHLLKLARLPGAKEFIHEYLHYLNQRLKEFDPPKRPEDAHNYAHIWYNIGVALLKLDPDRYREEVKQIGIKVLDTVVQRLDKIRVEHTPYKGLTITDDEARVDILEKPLDLLTKVVSEEELDKLIFSKYSDYVKALYLYYKASNAKFYEWDYEKAPRLIDEALKYAPSNKTLRYFRAFWKYQYGSKVLIILFKSYQQGCNLLKEAIQELEDLSRQEVSWKEPAETLEKARKDYKIFCQ